MPGESLSPRERQILLMVARGASSAAIGELLHLSSKTVDTYRSRLMAKLNLGDVAAVVRWAIRNGLISAEEP
jgi:DNA-binding CsgD family transcriptional regulator